jgi:phosphatidylserine/phosphatidylglycerophosphate/cardiolipin synthase-like enzyme
VTELARTTPSPVDHECWFVSASERGNPATMSDAGREPRAWTEGNDVTVLVDGAAYFAALADELRHTGRGDWVYLTDLQVDGDERLAGPGTAIATMLAGAARRGVEVRGLLWRSHPVGHAGAERTNLDMARTVNEAGGDLVLDHRVRRGGSHHQKLVVIHRPGRGPGGDVAFVGGIDLAHGRHDDATHAGDTQPVQLGERYGDRPPWHDVQLRIRGPAVGDLAFGFRERWEDDTPLDTHTLRRWVLARLSRKADHRAPLAPPVPHSSPCGPHAVQVLRTYPARRRGYPFAPRGERSVARAYIKAFANARRLVYLEDQYLWSLDAARALCEALRRHRELRCVIVIPRYPDPDGVLGAASRFGRWRVQRALERAGPGRVTVFDLENEAGTPVYVHAKVCIIDDVWMAVGSDNLNRRSWTHDSELCCAIVDPIARLPRETRIRLAHEHLACDEVDVDDLTDPARWYDTLVRSAEALDRWYADRRSGLPGTPAPRPRGRLRVHAPDRVSTLARPVLHLLHAWVLDPDGRPRDLHRESRF